MFSRLRYINKTKLNYITKRYNTNNQINKLLEDVKKIKEKNSDICDYNLMKFLLNYKSYDKNYDINIIIKEINVMNKTLKLSNNEVLDIIIALKETGYMNTKDTEKTLEAVTFIGLLCGVGTLLVVI